MRGLLVNTYIKLQINAAQWNFPFNWFNPLFRNAEENSRQKINLDTTVQSTAYSIKRRLYSPISSHNARYFVRKLLQEISLKMLNSIGSIFGHFHCQCQNNAKNSENQQNIPNFNKCTIYAKCLTSICIYHLYDIEYL